MNPYCDFVRSPESIGMWCLRISFDPRSRHEYDDFFRFLERSYSIETELSSHSTLYRKSSGRSLIETDWAPTRLLRIFAYCEAASIADKREAIFRRELFYGPRSRNYVRRLSYDVYKSSEVPKKISAKKRASLKKASLLYITHFFGFAPQFVPENPSKLDFVNEGLGFFQVTEELGGAIRIFCPDESLLEKMEQLFQAIPVAPPQLTRIKIFSPAEALSEMFSRSVELIPAEHLSSERRTLRSIYPIISEIHEARCIHAIRACGVAVEELISEIYETYFGQRAPEVPLGGLLKTIEAKTELALGKRVHSNESGDIESNLEQVLTAERSKAEPSKELLILAASIKMLSKQFRERIPGDDDLDRLNGRSVLPRHVRQIMREFLPLRNKVSHRADRVRSTSTIGYVEASNALRALAVLAMWWESERNSLNYSKPLIDQTLKRNEQLGQRVD